MATIQLEDETLGALQAQAASRGMTLSEYLEYLARAEGVDDAVEASSQQRAQAWETFVTQMRTWGQTQLPAGHVVDDSRESIYAGRGE